MESTKMKTYKNTYCLFDNLVSLYYNLEIYFKFVINKDKLK